MCDEFCEQAKNFIFYYSDPLYAVIPSTFEEYFAQLNHGCQTLYRKAKRNGFMVKKVDKITPKIYKDILSVYRSKKARQNRPINYKYCLMDFSEYDLHEGWPHLNYNDFKCPRHYYDFYGCFLKGKLVAHLEILHCDELAMTFSTMGHGDYLKMGIMRYLFIETIRLTMGNIKYLQYGQYVEGDPRLSFLRDLCIIEHDGADLLRTVSKNTWLV